MFIRLLLIAFVFSAPLLGQDPVGDHAGHDHGPIAEVEEEGEPEFYLRSLESPAGPQSSLPNLVKGADWETYLSWVDSEAGGVAVLRISRLGTSSWSAPMEVVRGTDLMLNWADFPSVQVSSSGVILASWLRKGEGPHAYSAEFRISKDRGQSFGPITRLHKDTSPVEHGFVSMAPMGKDQFGVIWLDGRAAATTGASQDQGHGAMSLYFRTIASNGQLGPEIVLDPRVCDCCPTHLGALPKGGLLAAYRDRSDGEVRDISTVRFDGKSWSQPRLAHRDGWKIAGCPVNGPRLALHMPLRGVAWFTAAGEGGPVAYAKVGGRDFGELRPIPIADKATLGRVDMVPVLLDSVLVTWLEDLGEGRAEWRLRRISKAGHKGESISIAAVAAGRASGFLRMVPAGKGAILTWTDSSGETPRVRTAALRPTNP